MSLMDGLAMTRPKSAGSHKWKIAVKLVLPDVSMSWVAAYIPIYVDSLVW